MAPVKLGHELKPSLLSGIGIVALTAVRNRRGDEAARDKEREARMALERSQSLTLLVSLYEKPNM